MVVSTTINGTIKSPQLSREGWGLLMQVLAIASQLSAPGEYLERRLANSCVAITNALF
jgi:hypothetical protein